MTQTNNRAKGVTFVELILWMTVVVAILAGVFIFWKNVRTSGRVSETVAILTGLEAALVGLSFGERAAVDPAQFKTQEQNFVLTTSKPIFDGTGVKPDKAGSDTGTGVDAGGAQVHWSKVNQDVCNEVKNILDSNEVTITCTDVRLIQAVTAADNKPNADNPAVRAARSAEAASGKSGDELVLMTILFKNRFLGSN